MRHILPLAVVLLAAVAAAEEPRRPRNTGEMPRVFTAQCSQLLSGATGACTIQQPASGANSVRLISATVYCSVACTVQQERAGTAATATAATVRDVNGKGVASRASVFVASNVGAGSVAVDPLLLVAGAESTIPYTNTVYLIGAGTAVNYTWRSSSISGTFRVTVMWEEY